MLQLPVAMSAVYFECEGECADKRLRGYPIKTIYGYLASTKTELQHDLHDHYDEDLSALLDDQRVRTHVDIPHAVEHRPQLREKLMTHR